MALNKPLNNRYYALRHGRSLANEARLIVSAPGNAIERYGLSELGRQQVTESIAAQRELDSQCIVISSDFKRARESAEIAHRLLNCRADMRFDQRLRERNFGELELLDDSRYADVWASDTHDADSRYHGAESVNSVVARTSELILDCERQLSKQSVLLVSHGDVLQILQTVLSGAEPAKHREQPHLDTAELRCLH